LLAWRLMHRKIPTDEHLILQGFSLVSMCSCCRETQESFFHLFFQCKYAMNFWRWLARILNGTIQFTSLDNVRLLPDSGWSPQCKIVMPFALLNILNVIWFVRNQLRYFDRLIPWQWAINLVIANVSLSGNKTSKFAGNSISEFSILKTFNINLKPPKAPEIREIIWHPPAVNWIKGNTDGTAADTPSKAVCGGLLRTHNAECIGCFSQNLGIG
jgi:hypothetical protein